MSGIAEDRLRRERKSWRKDHPLGFYARPGHRGDGSANLMEWEAGIPGPTGTDWQGGLYVVTLTFNEDYPTQPPVCKFKPPIFHPNVFTSGNICLSILKQNSGWKSSISLKQLLLGIQDLLTHPNPDDPAHCQANQLYIKHPEQYRQRIRQQAKQMAGPV